MGRLELITDVIGRVLEERREAEEQERSLKEELDRLTRKREELAEDGSARESEQIQSIDLEIGKLKTELAKQIEREKNACMIARTFSAGD